MADRSDDDLYQELFRKGQVKQKMKANNLFTTSPSVRSSRILYTPSPFARSSLLHLQEVGSLTAMKPHISKREKLHSYLCFVVEDGDGELAYEGKKYELSVGDVVFIDCRKEYSHSTGNKIEKTLWSLQWCHFYGPSMQAIYAKYCERGGEPVIHPSDYRPYIAILRELYEIAASSDYIRDMRINEKLSITIKKGSKTTLKPKLTPSNSTQKITYVSSNKKLLRSAAKVL